MATIHASRIEHELCQACQTVLLYTRCLIHRFGGSRLQGSLQAGDQIPHAVALANSKQALANAIHRVQGVYRVRAVL